MSGKEMSHYKVIERLILFLPFVIYGPISIPFIITHHIPGYYLSFQ